MKKVLLFAPAAVISAWDTSIKDLSQKLKVGNYEVTTLRCDGMYSDICVAMPAFNVNENSPTPSKKEICSRCFKYRNASDDWYPGQVEYLEDYMDELDIQSVNRTLQNITRSNWFEYEYDGLKIGRIACYEFFLTYKIKNLELSVTEWEMLQLHLKNVLYTHFAAKNYFEKNNTDTLIVYNRFYSVNNVFTEIAKYNQIKVISIQNEGPAYDVDSRFHSYLSAQDQLRLSNSSIWDYYKDVPLRPREIRMVLKHLKSVLGLEGTLSYSNEPTTNIDVNEIYSKLALSPTSKKVLIPTSSADERFTLEVLGYLNHCEGGKIDSLFILKELISIAPKFLDHEFIFRIHPREFPNKREGVQSPHGSELLEFIQNVSLPNNVKINTPLDDISIANLALVTDFIVNVSSSVGLDFAALGLKVSLIMPSRHFAYPTEINTCYADLESCLSNITSLHTEQEFSNKMQLLAFRWMYFKYFRNNHKIDIVRIDRLHRVNSILEKIFPGKGSDKISSLLARSLAIFTTGNMENPFVTDKYLAAVPQKSSTGIFLRSLTLFLEINLILYFSARIRSLLRPRQTFN